MIEITNELLAAYAEGRVTSKERNAVRNYLSAHPEELESIMIMMDEDFDIELEQDKNIDLLSCSDNSTSPLISYSSAAFAPRNKSVAIHSPKIHFRKSFDACLNNLIEDIFD